MKLLATILISVVLLVGCNAVSDMKDMFEKQELVQKAIKEKYGLQSEVGWNMHNGKLTQVTVSFNADQVRDKKVSELESAARDAVGASFKSKPQVLNVQIACKPKQSTYHRSSADREDHAPAETGRWII